MSLDYQEFVPRDPAVRRLLRCCWSIRGHARGGNGQRVLPDGCADLLFDLSAGAAHALWAGTMTRALCLPPSSGWIDLFGLRFAPGGLQALLPVAMDAITDATVALPELPTPWAEQLARRLGACATLGSRCAAVDRALRAATVDGAALDACRALDQLEHQPVRRVSTLAAAWGMSERGLERRFRRWLGVSPKQHLRFLRFERCRQGLLAGTPTLDLVEALGFVDQAHLIHEFRAFTGLSPAAWRREQERD